MSHQNFWFTPEEWRSKDFVNECDIVELLDKYNEPENEGAAFYNPRIKPNAIQNTSIQRYLIVSDKFIQDEGLLSEINLESFFTGVCFQTDTLHECFDIDPAILGEALIFDTKLGKSIYLLKQVPEYKDCGILGMLRVESETDCLKYYKKR